MGWTCYSQSNSPKNKKEERIEIDRIFESYDETKTINTVLAASKVGTTWYIAMQIETFIKKDDRVYEIKDGKIVIGVVLLTSRKDGEWCYKEIEESGYPYACECPKYILDMLSPMKKGCEYEMQWRNACLEKINNKPPKIQIGDKIKTKDIKGYIGSRCYVHNRWEVCGYRRTMKRVMKYFRCLDTGAEYRLTRSHLIGAVKID